MGQGWTPLRWLLQPFTSGMTATEPAPSQPIRAKRVTQALGDVAASALSPAAQGILDAFIAKVVADSEPASFVIETVVEPTPAGNRQQMILLYPKGRRHDGQSRQCEELIVADLPAGTTALALHQANATGHAMAKQLERRLRDDAAWLDAELEAGLKLGFPADWRDYRFVG
jgi:hypothetical protein